MATYSPSMGKKQLQEEFQLKEVQVTQMHSRDGCMCIQLSIDTVLYLGANLGFAK